METKRKYSSHQYSQYGLQFPEHVVLMKVPLRIDVILLFPRFLPMQ